MKWLLLFFILSICACKKPIEHNNQLAGKWKRTQIWVNPGNGGSWQPDNSFPPFTIEFTADGKFVSNDYFYKDYNRYRMIDATTIELSSSIISTRPAVTIKVEFISNTEIRMTYTCIEGCGDVFVRIK